MGDGWPHTGRLPMGVIAYGQVACKDEHEGVSETHDAMMGDRDAWRCAEDLTEPMMPRRTITRHGDALIHT
ncbi:hypothetical protein B296_00031855 [Ensete ventricosum]|uniref:Uncharacterized protein n=1 Tax=Ensete ventricosum TaxID=4639 RepID=A0A426Y2H1_ENSVE|nr:hypothetical protein B296_00031855 [Ensete ventricosum]